MFNKKRNWNTIPLIKAIESGVNNLSNNKGKIDALNVFPVPDGDTGSNMVATANYAFNELINNPEIDFNNSGMVLKAFAKGMLFGARGNSGVIFSQIIKGFSVVMESKSVIKPFDCVLAFQSAKEYAYKSILNPIEGTMLTVITDITKTLESKITFKSSMNEVLAIIAKSAKESVLNTPNLLAVLKEVGVVDSGAEGFSQFLEGIRVYVETGKIVRLSKTDDTERNRFSFLTNEETFKGDFGYCTEFIIEIHKIKTFNKDKFKDDLSKIGDSLVIVQDEEIVKVHIHTKKPGDILNLAHKKGEFIKLKCDNMIIQANRNKASQSKNGHSKHHAKLESEDKKKSMNEFTKNSNIAIVAIVAGRGLINDFYEYGVSEIVEGGQTMNPSTLEISEAIKTLTAKQVIVLPNNSNVILACQQAANTIPNKKIVVIPTKNVMQGLSALHHFNDDVSINENNREMNDIILEIGTGAVTLCTRDTKIKNVKVKKDHYLSIVNNNIVKSSKTIVESAINVIKKLVKKDSELITIYYGSESSRSEAEQLVSKIEANYNLEIEIREGGQPVYHFFFLVE